jgi:hypothetical protein
MVQLHILVIICGAMILSIIMFFLGLVLSMGKTADLEEELDRKDKALRDIEAELNNLKIEDAGKKELLDKVYIDDPERNLGYMEAGL